MNTNKKNDNIIDAILKDAHGEIEPPDSWQTLRTRIDRKINSGELRLPQATQFSKDVAFWRRIALSLAACLLITLGLLIYTIGFAQRTKGHWQRPLTGTNQGLLSQAQLKQLSTIFSYVRQLFGQHSPWIVVGSGDDAEIGVDGQIARTADTSKVVIVRLVVNLEKQNAKSQYFDIVTFSNQQASFQVLLADASVMDVSLKPILRNDGTIAVEINAQVDSGSQASGSSIVADNVFTSLVRMRANGDWVNIDAVAQSMPNI